MKRVALAVVMGALVFPASAIAGPGPGPHTDKAIQVSKRHFKSVTDTKPVSWRFRCKERRDGTWRCRGWMSNEEYRGSYTIRLRHTEDGLRAKFLSFV